MLAAGRTGAPLEERPSRLEEGKLESEVGEKAEGDCVGPGSALAKPCGAVGASPFKGIDLGES